MRSYTCPDCSQWFGSRPAYTVHIGKHGRIVPDPHTRVVTADDGEEAGNEEP